MRIWKFGDDIDTDAIIPGRFLTEYEPKKLAEHVFEGTRDDCRAGVCSGDIIVAGKNFGCGSSREHAPLALLGAGVRIVVAESFARIFYRNAVNTGLLPLVCSDTGGLLEGHEATVDLAEGCVESDGARYPVEPVPPFMQAIIDAGGLVEYAKAMKEVEICTGSQR
ncbi:3-isopropylmalate/(R)-2-methylmalate dehydratase small subunit [Methanofollis sp. W23]|uniref:LeuD/DmdB family oxidoreductase small subunit n=1 Tax=Methanofollis sp. W23 TaxID=2817849 RepID=UPI001AE7480C|nr:3-isopropylmalate dehydratase [Methanofollis sp. W23]MBP2145511.1 3-isopropylmalate/(R)-2-methylmalate dehydratase small subunit [Methanofollis sp. W23]